MIKLKALLAGTTFQSWKFRVKVQSPKFHPQLAQPWFFFHSYDHNKIKSQILSSLDQRLKVIYNTHIFGTALKS
jgi:hypothetical protein